MAGPKSHLAGGGTPTRRPLRTSAHLLAAACVAVVALVYWLRLAERPLPGVGAGARIGDGAAPPVAVTDVGELGAESPATLPPPQPAPPAPPSLQVPRPPPPSTREQGQEQQQGQKQPAGDSDGGAQGAREGAQAAAATPPPPPMVERNGGGVAAAAAASPLRAPPAGLDYARSLDTPAWCKALVANPRKHVPSPDCASRTSDAHNSRCARFFSQYEQDVWLWLAIAQLLPTQGTYVDVGANNPTMISNSFFFDRCLRWRGVCVEAQHKYHARLRALRTCALAPCVSDREEDVEFVLADDLGGIAETNKNVNGTADWQEKARVARKEMVHCYPLKAVLAREGITDVTYLSLDVEGAELRVLNGIDWEKTHIWFITAEGAKSNPVAQMLLDRGYKLVHRTGDGFFASPRAVRLVEQIMGEGYLSSIVIPE